MNGKEQINSYINNSISNIKGENSIDKSLALKNDVRKDVVIGIILWIAGSTLIGMPIVYIIIGYRGFCFGYTIAAIMAVLGMKQGMLYCFSGLFMQNIIFIPSIIFIASSGMNLYKNIKKEKKRENLKINIIRHTAYSLIGILGIIFSSVIEVCCSTNILVFFAKYL